VDKEETLIPFKKKKKINAQKMNTSLPALNKDRR
jgi:hypothetical protein